MSRILMAVLATALFFFPQAINADAASEVRAVLELSEEAWNEKETDEIAAQYHKDFVLISNEGVLSRQQQLSDIRTILEDKDPGTLDHSDIVVKVLSDDHVVVYGRLTLTFEDGSSLSNWFTSVYVNTPFGWKVLLRRS